ncbi:MAG: tyrosine-type recombinase/integrase [Chitinivibrionales bacterium]|nr:tyrosine-type recombinase/integrase [Chitinivibrionales bacterium]MBD3395226.1 tyrosine-type recombinase/integrase [Chitinivibrionales bacterium]
MTMNHYTTWAKAILNYAVRFGLIEKNPIRHFEKLREVARDVVLNEIDRQRLLNVVDREAPHLSAVLRFALQVPCRRSELVNMKRDALDLFNNCIRVRCGTMKNKNLAAYKPIPPDMLDYFRNLPSDTDYLFYRRDRDGVCRGLGDFKRAWGRCLRLAGIKGLHFHDSRHMSATELLNNGTPEGVVVEIAGWTSNAMLRTYYHRAGVQSLNLVRFSSGREANPEGILKASAAAGR